MLGGNEAQDQLRRDIKRLSDDLIQIKNSLGAGQREQLQRMKDEAATRLKDAQEMARVRAKQMDSYVHDRPWTSVVVAVMVGAVLGMVFSRRR